MHTSGMQSQGFISSHTQYKTHVNPPDQDTYAVDSRDLEVIYQLNHHVLVGVDGVTLSHLKAKGTMGWSKHGREARRESLEENGERDVGDEDAEKLIWR